MTMQQITDCLRDVGPMSGLELTYHIGIGRLGVNKQVRQLRQKGMVYITHYDRQPDGQQGRCVPIYALGSYPDAQPIPALSRPEIRKRYTDRNAAILSTRRYHKRRAKLGAWAGLIKKRSTS